MNKFKQWLLWTWMGILASTFVFALTTAFIKLFQKSI